MLASVLLQIFDIMSVVSGLNWPDNVNFVVEQATGLQAGFNAAQQYKCTLTSIARHVLYHYHVCLPCMPAATETNCGNK